MSERELLLKDLDTATRYGDLELARVLSDKLKALQEKPKPLPSPWFRGYDYAHPMSDDEIKRGGQLWRSIGADAVMAPSQLVAGLADVGGELASKAGLPYSNNERMSPFISALRNRLAGRDGGAPGPATGFVQGAVTAPFSPLTQAIGLGAGLAGDDQSPLVEGAKGALTSLLFKGGSKMISHSKPTSIAQRKINQTAIDENIDMTMGTQGGQPLMKEVERRAERNVLLGGVGGSNYATRTRERIDDQFAEALWRRIGFKGAKEVDGNVLVFNEFSPEHFNFAAKEIGKKLDKPFVGKSIDFNSFSLKSAVENAVRRSDKMNKPGPLLEAAELVQKKIDDKAIDSSEMNVLLDDLRGIVERSYDDKNKTAAEAVRELVKAVRANAISHIPTQSGKEQYKRALVEWANLKTVEDVFKRSAESARGNIDPSKLKDAIMRQMGDEGYTRGRADLASLANLGSAMRGGSVLPEGVKWNPLDPSLYLLFNNPASMFLRKRNPLDEEAVFSALRPIGTELNTP